MIQVLAIVGPTGSGKTSLSIALAEALETEVVSADSMQFYRGMAIGTGQPSADQLACVKHHFIGQFAPTGKSSAGAYQERARAVVESINARGKPAIVVGGSGLYVRALIDGLFDGPPADEALRRELQAVAEESGPDFLHRRLAERDPAAAARIDAHDVNKVVRALEVSELSGAPITALHEQQHTAQPLTALQFAIAWPRDALYDRINRRVDQMLEDGFREEVQALIDAGYEEALLKLRAIGYPEMVSVLRNEMSFDDAIATMKMNSRRYAKRQLTWYRADDRIDWLAVEEYPTDAARVEHILAVLQERSASARDAGSSGTPA